VDEDLVRRFFGPGGDWSSVAATALSDALKAKGTTVPAEEFLCCGAFTSQYDWACPAASGSESTQRSIVEGGVG
jgi:hypothetical protein